MHNALAVYVCEWYHIAGLGLPTGMHPEYESRVEANTQNALAILGKLQTKATFFVLGCVAEKFPDTVKKIEQAGHEVAAMGYRYRPVYDHTSFSFRDDLKKCLRILEDIVQEKILGYRAPDFSITNRSKWAIDILCEEGIKYDCSIVPVRHSRYGIPSSPRVHYRIKENLIEFPPSVIRMLGQNFLMGGERAYKSLPYGLIKHEINTLNKQNIPAHNYFYVWELDETRPRVAMPFLRRLVECPFPQQVKNKITRLLSDFQYAPVWNILEKTIGEDEVI